MADTNEQVTKNQKHLSKDFVVAVGRRKNAVARVRLYPHVKDNVQWDGHLIKKGDIWVNAMTIDQYFHSDTAKAVYMEPFRVTNTLNKYGVTIKVSGGGTAGQVDAVTHGIARALATLDPSKFRPILKKKGLLTRDPRVRERRKVGTGGKARREKQSPKR